jgi:putative ABC transport system permease protein
MSRGTVSIGPAFEVVLALLVVVAVVAALIGRLGVSRAVVTASVRLGWPVIAPIVAGAAPAATVIVLGRTMPLTEVALLPIAGILIGGAMTATSLAGRRALDELRSRHGEYEAALALGFLPRDAALEVCRPTAGQALVPAMDQTRTVGLVTLPGAFVGVLLGGGSALQAGATQLLVLIALLAAEAIAAAVTLELVARGVIRRPLLGNS